MGKASITWDTDTRRATMRIRRLQYSASDLTDVWKDMVKEFKSQNARQFAAQGRGKGKWKELSTKYAKRKARLYPGKGILERTGGLRASLTEHLDVEIISPHAVIAGSRSKIGAYHRTGAYRSRGGKLPKRPPVQLNKGFRSQTRKQIRAHMVADQLKGQGATWPGDGMP